MLTTLLNLIKRVLGRFSLRDVGHFGAAFVGAIAVSLQTTTLPATKAAWIALGSGALAVAFRQVFPNAAVSPAQLESYVARGEKILVGLQKNPVQVVTAPSNADILSAVAQVIAHASAQGIAAASAGGQATVNGQPADLSGGAAATATGQAGTALAGNTTAAAMASALGEVPPTEPPLTVV